jgi:MFS family permease
VTAGKDDPAAPAPHQQDRPGGPPRPATALERDAVTRLGYTALATWAWFLYGFGAILPLLRAEQNTSRLVLGLHSLALAAGGLVAGLVAVPLVRRIRRRGAMTLASATITVGVLGLVLAPVPALTVAATLVTGIGGSMMLNAVMPALSDHHGAAGPAALSEGNAAAAGVGLVAPLAVGAGAALGWTWRPAALLVIPLVGVLLVALRKTPSGTPALDTGLPPRGALRSRLPVAFWVLMCLVTASVAIEFCCTAWSADLLHQRTGMSPGAASGGVTAVVAGMAAGRVGMGRLALRYPSPPLLLAALALTSVGWLIVWLSITPVPAMTGLLVLGFGIAGQYPLGVALLLAAVPEQTDQAIGALSLGIAAASGLAPFGVGALATATSTHTAFLLVPVLVLAASAALLLAARGARSPPASAARS